MEVHHFDDFRIAMDKQGATQYAQVTYPVRYGIYSEIETDSYIFQFDLNGEIKYIQGRHSRWPDRNEWLKRTVADDWVYYASEGGYKRIFSLLGEYYLPRFSYPTNTIFRQKSIQKDLLSDALDALNQLRRKIERIASTIGEPRLQALLQKIAGSNSPRLARRGQQFHSLLGGPISVLPPDARRVDYNLIPIILADGCLYNCDFCRVKSGQGFRLRTEEQVSSQIEDLSAFLGRELPNYNAVFLGQHDALHAGKERIEAAARMAYENFQLKRSNLRERYLFLFGSVASLLHAGEELFSTINRLPYYTYINIGLESFDQDTLKELGKPVRAHAIEEAFARMQATNRGYPDIEVTANLVLGGDLPSGHEESIIEHAGTRLERYYGKGAFYFSPLYGLPSRERMKERFYRIKNAIRLPAYLYLIQRL